MAYVAWPEWVLRFAWQDNLALNENGAAFVLIKEEQRGQEAMPLPVEPHPRDRERVFKVKRHAA